MAKEAREESMVGGARAEPPAGISAVKGGREEPWWRLDRWKQDDRWWWRPRQSRKDQVTQKLLKTKTEPWERVAEVNPGGADWSTGETGSEGLGRVIGMILQG